MPMRLEILHRGEVVHSQEIPPRGLKIGRSASNDLVLRSAGISGHHALLYFDGGALWVRDLGSTNGTFVAGERICEPRAVTAESTIGLGPELAARVREGRRPAPPLVLSRTGSVLAWPVDRARFPIPDTEAILRVGLDAIWLAHRGEEVGAVVPGVPFELDGQHYLLEEAVSDATTVRPVEAPLPYTLTVDLGGNRAELSEGSRSVVLRTENRVATLHVLGSALHDDPRGWVYDDALMVGIWGRAAHAQVPNNLNVLIHRTRSQVERAGFDRWLIERRTGETRLRVAEVHLVG